MPHDVLNLLCVEGGASRAESDAFFRAIAPLRYSDSFTPSPSRRVESPLIDFRRIVPLPPPPRYHFIRGWLRSWLSPYDLHAVQTAAWGTKWPAYALWFEEQEQERSGPSDREPSAAELDAEDAEEESRAPGENPRPAQPRPTPAAWLMRPGVSYLTRGYVRYTGPDTPREIGAGCSPGSPSAGIPSFAVDYSGFPNGPHLDVFSVLADPTTGKTIAFAYTEFATAFPGSGCMTMTMKASKAVQPGSYVLRIGVGANYTLLYDDEIEYTPGASSG